MSNPRARPDLNELGQKLVENGPVKTLPTSRRVRILFNGEYVADTTSAVFVWEHEYYPYYYVPRASFLQGAIKTPPTHDSYQVAELQVGQRTTDRILVFGDELGAQSKALEGMVRFEFNAADAWFEEDTSSYVHPKDPFRRVDVLHSSRQLEVRVAGVLVAQTSSAYHLYETGLPCRYYIPATAVNRTRLADSKTTTACPYKGVANYYDVEVEDPGGQRTKVKDLVWYYKTPTLECANIAGFLCFYQEKEEVEFKLDGTVLPRPKTPWT
ncbi:hypothetical protein M434DRAFT_397641 [Hypoxylon sp. CO27-5]|nr:hypothetical protein M434DRAFT_397641 [Hypoxylon sp. CO27-5]